MAHSDREPMSWQSNARSNLLLLALLCFDLLCGVVVARTILFQAPNVEFLDAATEFGTNLHIASNFLPVGFSAVVGLGYRLLGGQTGMTVVAIAFSLAMVASAWIYLRTMGVSVRVTLLLCALLSLYPDVLLSMNKVIDTNVTAALLFGFVTTLMFVVRGGGRTLWLAGCGIGTRARICGTRASESGGADSGGMVRIVAISGSTRCDPVGSATVDRRCALFRRDDGGAWASVLAAERALQLLCRGQ